MGTLKFDSWDDVRLRLNRTICMYRGRPYLVANEGIEPPSKDIYLYPLDYRERDVEPHQVRIRINHEDPEFECRSPELGYLYWNGDATYVTRIPDRRQRQGITADVLRLDPRLMVGPHTLFCSKAMEDCILGNHKSLQEAIVMIERGEARSVPVSRHFAIGRIQNNHVLGLYYRNRLIGTQNEYDQSFVLFPTRDLSFLHKAASKLGLV